MAKKKKKATKTRRRSGRRGRSRVGALGAGVSMETLGAVVIGGVVSKATNGIVKNVAFIQKNKWAMPVAKLGGGYLLATHGSNRFIQDMGTGVVLEGAFHALEAFAPNVFAKLSGTGRGVGYTLIDLDEMPGAAGVRGNRYKSMEDEQEVAGLYSADTLAI